MGKKGQGATEYLLMLAAVLVIVAIAVYYITTAAPSATITGSATISGSNVIFTPTSMVGCPENIPAADWEYAVYRGATAIQNRTAGPGNLVKNIPISLSCSQTPQIGDVVKLWYKGSALPDAATVSA
ncbi:MAG: class III signal peptide-containing protein [Candidatus Hadarchaeales archaeon]